MASGTNRLQVNVSPRHRWEALDLGVLMVQRYWPTMIRSWLLAAAPIYVIAAAIFDAEVAVWVLWWLKPWLDRIHLDILSKAVFGERVGKVQLGAIFRNGAILQTIPWLLWRRFSLSRSFLMPINQLENLKGKTRSKRAQILTRSTVSTWCTIIFIHVEQILALGLVVLAWMFLPNSDFLGLWDWFLEHITWTSYAYFFAVLIVEPFYVAAGFSLYLNRRTILECWDLEIAFKKIIEKREADHRGLRGTAALLVGALFLSGTLMQNEVYAAERDDLRIEVREILDGPEFHQMEEYEVPSFLKKWMDAEDEELEDRQPISSAFLVGISKLMVVLAIAVTLMVVILVIVEFWRRRNRKTRTSTVDKGKSLPAFLGELTPEDDLAALKINDLSKLSGYWEAGKQRKAISLMYRLSLLNCINKCGVTMLQSDTETDCLNAVRRSGINEVYRFMQSLTGHWLRLAYAHQPPDTAVFKQLLAQWPSAFNGGADDQAN